MGYRIRHDLFDNYVRIAISGEWPSGKSKEIASKLYNIADKNKKQKLLIDIRNILDPDGSVINDYLAVTNLMNAGFSGILKVAVLDNNLSRKERNDFFEVAAENRGLRFKFFYESEEKALKWLLNGGHND